jgi:EmrB/QacA subfamily drug resistance transporter
MAATTASTPSTSVLATRRGRLTLALLCTIAFLDFIDASIVNVALPSIREDLHFSVQGLQWVPSGYLLTYGGFMLLGGRAADLFGRRRILLAGTTVFALASLLGGLAQDDGVLVAGRLIQGVGAAMMLPAALSLLTTTFAEGKDRNTALGVWGAMAGLASAAGVLLGGVLSEGPGWRWILLINPVICAGVLAAIAWLTADEVRPRRERGAGLDVAGALLATAGMLLLVYTLVKAPDVGWGAGRTLGGLGVALALLAGFVGHEARARDPLLPLSIFRIRGLAAADVTQLVGVAGFLAVFFFLTLYMQNVLGYSQIRTGLSYLPVCFGVAITAGVVSQLLTRVGTRPIIVSGALIAAGGIFWLSRADVGASYAGDLLPGLVIMAVGLGAVFVGVTTAANAGVPSHQAGLAAALLNSSQQVGGALGLAIFSALATARTDDRLAAGAHPAEALTAGAQRALLVSALFLVAAALIAIRAPNAKASDDEAVGAGEAVPMPAQG